MSGGESSLCTTQPTLLVYHRSLSNVMSPNAATKGNALWKPGTNREISMDTSKALTKEEAPQAWSEIIPLSQASFLSSCNEADR